MVQLSHPYMSTGKTIVLTIQTFVSKVMFLLFKMLSKFVIAFLPRSKCLLILWPQLPSAVISKPEKIKSLFVSKLKLKLQYFSQLMRRVDPLEKTRMLGRIGGRRRRG